MIAVWKKTPRLCCVLLAALLCLCLFGCGGGEAAENFCRIDGKTLSFLSEDELQKLKKPLAALLSNQPEDFSSEAPDPSAPSIPSSYSCGLFDVTADGIPELLVFPSGYTGSSGCATYFIYDIPTGEKLFEEGGDTAHNWCMYYSMEEKTCSPWILYQYRSGWSDQLIYTAQLEYENKKLTSHTRFFIDRESQGLGQERELVACYVDGERGSAESFYWAYSDFQTNYIRLPDTALRMIDWDDICQDGDDRFVKGEKMAEALLSSGQAFLTKNQ